MIQSRKRNDPPPRPVTFTAAEDLNPFEGAELWADRMAPGSIDGRTPYDELAELGRPHVRACQMAAALAANLPALQRDARRGLGPEAVAGALGDIASTSRTSAGTSGPFGSVTSIIGSRPGITQTSTKP